MSQNYDPNVPAAGATVQSAPIRDNINAIFSNLAGESEPAHGVEGSLWWKPSVRTMYAYQGGSYRTAFTFRGDGSLVVQSLLVAEPTLALLNTNFDPVDYTGSIAGVTSEANPALNGAYFSDGASWVALSSSYVHPNGDGDKHVPANGTSNDGKYLQATAVAGVYQWADLEISKTYPTVDPVSEDYVVSLSSSVAIPVDLRVKSLTITLNNSVENHIRARIHDLYKNAGTHQVVVKETGGATIGIVNSNGGAIEFAWSGTSWILIDKFENLFDRNSATKEVTLNNEDTLITNKMKSGQASSTFTSTPAEFTNPGANVDQDPLGWGSSPILAHIDAEDYESTIPANIADGTTGSSALLMSGGIGATGTIVYNLNSSSVVKAIGLWHNDSGLPDRITQIRGRNNSGSWHIISDINLEISQVINTYNIVAFSNSSPYDEYEFTLELTEFGVNGSGYARDTRLYVVDSYETSDTSFEDHKFTDGPARDIFFGSLNLKNATNVELANNDATIEYSTDNGSTWSPPLSYANTLELGNVTSLTSLWFRYSMANGVMLAQSSIQTTASFSEVKEDGMYVNVDGEEVASLTRDGVHAPNGTFGSLAKPFSAGVSGFSDAEANVDQDAAGWGNNATLTDVTIEATGLDANSTELIDGDAVTINLANNNNVGQVYDFGAAVLLDSIAVLRHAGNAYNNYSYVKHIEGSDDDVSYSDIVAFNDSSLTDQIPADGDWPTGSYQDYLFANGGTSWRYYRITFESIGGTSGTAIQTIQLRRNVTQSTNNTFVHRAFTDASAKNIDLNSLVLKDAGDINIADGEILIEYSTNNGSSWSAQLGLNATKALGILSGITSLWLRYEMVGAEKLSSSQVNSTSTYTKTTANGIEMYVDSIKVGEFTPAKSVLGSQGQPFQAGVGGFSDAESNVDQQAGSWGNESVAESTPFNDGNYNTSNLSPYNVSASTEFHAGYAAYLAFNGLNSGNSGWMTPNGVTTGTLTINIGTPTTIVAYRVGGGVYNNHVVCSIRDYTIQGSVNGSDWDVLHTVTGQEGFSVGNFSPVIQLTQTGAYNQYRVDITANNGGTNVGIMELEMYSEGPASDTNSFVHKVFTDDSPKNLDLNSITLKNDSNITLTDGSTLVEYSTDNGSNWSTQLGLSATKALGVLSNVTSFWLRYTMVGTNRMSSSQISSTATYTEVTPTGVKTYINSILSHQVTDQGVIFRSYTTTERDAITSPPEGLTIFNSTTGQLNTYNGSSWV